MVLKEVRDEGKHKKLLFKILIEEDALIISAKSRENEEPVLINIESIVAPYVDKSTVQKLRRNCSAIYSKKIKEP